MTLRNRRFPFCCIHAFALLCTPAKCILGQVNNQSASSLIRFLTYQSERPRDGRLLEFNCGQALILAEDDRKAARSLVKLGALAIPDLQDALDSIELRGQKSEFVTNAGWLFHVYARIMGPTAYARLFRIIGDPKLAFLQNSLDDSVALAFGLTSYVSFNHAAGRIPHCRAEQPRDALDQLILAWERNDQSSMEANLGPNGRSALDRIIKGKTWSEVRAKLWRGQSASYVAVGYHFEVSGLWSEPEETLDDEKHSIAKYPREPELDTVFENRQGGGCGTHRIIFKKAAHEDGSTMYLIDNGDLEELLHVIGSCAAY